MSDRIDLRPSPIAGQWYPADRKRLAEGVDAYIAAAGEQRLGGKVVGVVAPHAGYRYSGPTAGYAFAAVRELKPDLVAILSPMHYPYEQPWLTTGHTAYVTPLGAIPVDQEAQKQLDAGLRLHLGCGLAFVRCDPEHSLEIQLPFLQRAVESDFHLLPVMLRDQSSATMRALGEVLGEMLEGRNALLVASSDLSHFYPEHEAELLDRMFLRKVEEFDPAGVLKLGEEGKAFACGYGAVAAVLWAGRKLGADQVRVLRYGTSGDATGDQAQVVGYGAAAMVRSEKPPEE